MTKETMDVKEESINAEGCDLNKEPMDDEGHDCETMDMPIESKDVNGAPMDDLSKVIKIIPHTGPCPISWDSESQDYGGNTHGSTPPVMSTSVVKVDNISSAEKDHRTSVTNGVSELLKEGMDIKHVPDIKIKTEPMELDIDGKKVNDVPDIKVKTEHLKLETDDKKVKVKIDKDGNEFFEIYISPKK